MFKKLKRSAEGAGVPHAKGTAGMATVVMPAPSKITLPMSQHIGAPAQPVVKKGDTVYVGTLVGKAGGFVSANIYSGVSGTVLSADPANVVIVGGLHAANEGMREELLFDSLKIYILSLLKLQEVEF